MTFTSAGSNFGALDMWLAWLAAQPIRRMILTHGEYVRSSIGSDQGCRGLRLRVGESSQEHLQIEGCGQEARLGVRFLSRTSVIPTILTHLGTSTRSSSFNQSATFNRSFSQVHQFLRWAPIATFTHTHHIINAHGMFDGHRMHAENGRYIIIVRATRKPGSCHPGCLQVHGPASGDQAAYLPIRPWAPCDTRSPSAIDHAM